MSKYKVCHLCCRLTLAVVVALAMSGCSVLERLKSKPPQPPVTNQWESHKQRLAEMQSWTLQGKLGVRLPNEANSAYVNWTQSDTRYAIRFNGPFGQGAAWIKGQEDVVVLEQAGKPAISATTPEELLFHAVGWEIPISELLFWVKGLPSPDSPVDLQHHKPDGTLDSLKQAGWTLSYPRYRVVDGCQLPAKIIAQRNEFKMTLIIKSWDIPQGFNKSAGSTLE